MKKNNKIFLFPVFIVTVVFIFCGASWPRKQIRLPIRETIPPRISLTPSWHSLGSGLDYEVVRLAFDTAGNLYAGGTLTVIGDNLTNKYVIGVSKREGSSVNRTNKYIGGVSRWDGSSWLPIGGSFDGFVRALAFDSTGNTLFAGGTFSSVGGNPVDDFVKWTGSSWSDIDSQIRSPVDVITFNSNYLYVGGAFKTAGGNVVNKIAKWDGNTWSGLGDGMFRDSADFYMDYVKTIAFYEPGKLYAGGKFTMAGGIPVSNVAKWDGSAWSALVGQGTTTNQPIHVMAVDAAGNLYAGGEFTTIEGTPVSFIAKWNGSQWSALGSGVDGPVYAITFDAQGNLYAGGFFTTAGNSTAKRIAKWDGSTWSPVGNGFDGTVYCLAFNPAGTKLYAGGRFTKAGSEVANHIAYWGTEW